MKFAPYEKSYQTYLDIKAGKDVKQISKQEMRIKDLKKALYHFNKAIEK